MEKIKQNIYSLLKWSEKYTKTDMVYLFHNGSWLGLGQVVSMGAAFLTSIAFANLLPPETYGLYKYVLSISSVILITTLTGMDSAITQSVARGYEGTLILGVKTKMKWGVLGSLASLIIAGYYFTQGNIQLTIIFCIVSIFVPFSESFDMYNALLWGKKSFGIQTKYNIIRKIISLILLVGVLFLTKNIYIILAVYFGTIAIPAGFFFWQTVKNHLSNTDSDPETIAYGKHLSLIGIIGLVAGELDKILVFHYLGGINLAIYTLSSAPTDQIKGLMKNLNSLAFPQYAMKSAEDIKQTIFHKLWILGLMVSAIVLMYILVAPLFFNVFFPKYLASIHYSQVLSISLIGAVLSTFLYTALESQKAKKQIYQYNLYSNIFSLIILFPLIYYFGIWGAVTSRFITRFFSLTLASVLIKKIN